MLSNVKMKNIGGIFKQIVGNSWVLKAEIKKNPTSIQDKISSAKLNKETAKRRETADWNLQFNIKAIWKQSKIMVLKKRATSWMINDMIASNTSVSQFDGSSANVSKVMEDEETHLQNVRHEE